MTARFILGLVVLVACIGGGSGRAVAGSTERPVIGESAELSRKLDTLYEQLRSGAMGWEDVREELRRTCNRQQLISLAFSKRRDLVNAAAPLVSEVVADLNAPEIKQLETVVDYEYGDPSDRLRAARLLAENRTRGVKALAPRLVESDPIVQAIAASGLAEPRSKAAITIRRRAVMVLLDALENKDDSGRIAQENLPPLEPWMIGELLKRLESPEAKPLMMDRGLTALATRLAAAPDAQQLRRMRAVYETALDSEDAQVRYLAVTGLVSQGVSQADMELYGRIVVHSDGAVRHVLFAKLRDAKAPWAVQLLILGLDDSMEQNRAACAYGLALLRHKPALKRLVDMVRRAPPPPAAYPEDCRAAGEAAAMIAGLDLDFDTKYGPKEVCPDGSYVCRIQYRSAAYRASATRLLSWWEGQGH